MDRSFFPNPMRKIPETTESENEDAEARLSESKKPLLENFHEEDIILNFLYIISP